MLEVAKDVKKSAMGHEQHAWLFIRLRCDPGQAGDKPNFLGLAPGCINADLCKQIVNTDFSAFLEIINSNLHRVLLVHIIMSVEKDTIAGIDISFYKIEIKISTFREMAIFQF